MLYRVIILFVFLVGGTLSAQTIDSRKKLERKTPTVVPVRNVAPADTKEPEVINETLKDTIEIAAPKEPRVEYVPNPRMLMGILHDANTGKPVANALVKVKKSDLAVFSNNYGVYNLELNKDLPVQIQVKVPGYKKLKLEITEPHKVYKLELQRK